MSVPIGTIVAYGGDITGNNKSELERHGWLPCNGDYADRETYKDLATVIGDAFGRDQDSKQFQLPDLRGRFLRGVDHGQGRDPDAKDRIVSGNYGNIGDQVGSLQSDEFKSHTHKITGMGDRSPFIGGDQKNNQSKGDSKYKASTYYDPKSEGGSETRPKNVYVNWIIKAKNV